jgi:CRP-like cAMP-binding protein
VSNENHPYKIVEEDKQRCYSIDQVDVAAMSCQTVEVIAMDSSSTYLFKGLSDSQMKKILAACKEIPVKKGQQIFKEGQEAKGVYIVRSGEIGDILVS